MSNRSRSRWLAGGGALLLVLSLSSVAAAHGLVADTNEPPSGAVDPATVVDATPTFQDADGNGIADACQGPFAPNPDAALAAVKAADLDGNGTISTSEAAQSDWTGGTNCDHGGYVSGVANNTPDTCAEGGTTTTPDRSTEATEAAQEAATETECDKPADQTVDQPPADCPVIVAPVAPVAPVVGTTTPDTAPNAHGTAVSAVAQSDAVGGKNCNHGGAVSEVANVHGTSAQTTAISGHADRTSKRNGARRGHGHGG